MRIMVAIIAIIIVGIVFTAALLINNRTLSDGQLDKITANCPSCHGRVPTYDVALTVHYKHAAFNCSRCHSDVSGLKLADSIHIDFKWLGLGILSVVVVAIITNFIIISGKGKAN